MEPSLHFGMCGNDLAATIRFIQDAQIRDLVCDVRQIPGRQQKNQLTQNDLRAFASPLAEAGIRLAVVTVSWISRDASGNQAESELATLCHDIGVLGEAGVPVAQAPAGDRQGHRPERPRIPPRLRLRPSLLSHDPRPPGHTQHRVLWVV